MTRRPRNWGVAIALQLALLLGAAVLSLGVGAASVPLKDTLAALLHPGAGTIESTILFDIRLPRLLLAIAVGGSLSLAGVLLQGMFRNTLVEPYTLGISGGAALGLCLCIVLKVQAALGLLSLPAAGFLGAALTAVVVYALGTRRGAMSLRDMVLIGVMISFICSSLVMLIMAMARTEDLQGIIFWTMGSLEEPNRGLVALALAVALAGLGLGARYCVALNALALGEDEALHLGLDVERIKRVLFLLVALLTGMSVAVAGIIGFVGLVVPHMVRLAVGRDHRILIVSAFVSGGAFLVLSDTLARVIIAPLEMPVGVITGIAGGIAFIAVLGRSRTGVGEL